MPEPVEGTSPYLPGLDGIRAIAVLAVVAYHLNLGWASGGLLGVGVFFVLSGYLITDLLVAEHRRHDHINFKRFWARRARRLLPALFLMLFVTVGFATVFDPGQLPALRDDLPAAIFYYSNWWFIYQHVSYFARFGPPSPLGHLWSLAIEEQFYLVWPILLFAGLRLLHSKRALVSWVLVAAAASAIEMAVLYVPDQDPTRVYDGTDTRAFALLIGAALALVLPRDFHFAKPSPGARKVLELTGGLALLGIFAMFWMTSEYEPFLYRGGMLLCALLTAVVIAITVHPGARLARVLGIAPLRWIGKRSYAIYLWHYPVIVLTTPTGAGVSLWRVVLQVGASFLLAALSWRYVEEPVRHGALGRAWKRIRRRGLSLPKMRPAGWGVTACALANGAICAAGLLGLVATPALSSGPTTVSILPPTRARPAPTTTSPRARPSRSASSRSVTEPTIPGASPSVALPPALPPSTGTTTTTTIPPRPGQGVTAIGDSIMIDAAPFLRRLLPGIVIDARIGQELWQVQAMVPKLKAEGAIGDRLIIELGTNGTYAPSELVKLLRSLGPMRRVVLVNTRVPRPWEQSVNATIAAVAKTYPDTTMVNWYARSAHHPGYFYPDGVHLDPAGAAYYASLIAHAMQAPASRRTGSPPPG